jgi:pimeloyl-ACP methyl ester carboxylesterase
VHCERRGDGPPLVLLHGIGHHWQAWLPVLDRLARQYTVYALDLPGFGASTLPGDWVPAGMGSAVALVAQALDDLGLQRPHLAGNSLGGALALELAASGRAASATVFSPAGFASPLEVRLALGRLRSLRAGTFLPEPLLRKVLSVRQGRVFGYWMLLGHPTRMPADQALVDALALRAGTGFEAIARQARGYAFRGEVGVPVTVAWGTRDRILPPRQARRARERLPLARHVPLPRAGHVPMFDEPELVAALILETACSAG